jgi:hypothetical protein
VRKHPTSSMFKILLALGLQLSAADFAPALDLQVIHASWL